MIRHPQGTVAAHIDEIGDSQVATSVIVAGELRFGAECKASMRLTLQMEAILRLPPLLPLADDADIHYGRLRADLERPGQPIGGNDMLIAAHALSISATLVTDNSREFERVVGLTLENWLRHDYYEQALCAPTQRLVAALYGRRNGIPNDSADGLNAQFARSRISLCRW